MDDLKTALLSMLLHTIEVAVCFLVAFCALHWFGQLNGVTEAVVGLVLVAIAKFIRAYEKCPTPDYVNPDK